MGDSEVQEWGECLYRVAVHTGSFLALTARGEGADER